MENSYKPSKSYLERKDRKLFEQECEHTAAIHFSRFMSCDIISLQDSGEDDSGTDATMSNEDTKFFVEVRRKGYPNHNGFCSSALDQGWVTHCIQKEGVYLNELTIERHKEAGHGFLYLVQFSQGPDPLRFADVTESRIDELLAQPYHTEKSTNTGNMQSVKDLPVDWFSVVPVNGLEEKHRIKYGYALKCREEYR